MNFEAKFQLGKAGVNAGFIQSLELAFKTHRQIRISALKSSGRDKDSMRKIADEIVSKLPFKAAYRVIGFTIIMHQTKK